ncbi:hypothetical protein [Burkholderia cenocepacia]|uniref:hypothetical protein n=1 Tax=Burkholderia cenocepacia TaxID=95486 RepID=UPI0021185172|nr:hypothetical protein [Burkholderia cenocepacia]
MPQIAQRTILFRPGPLDRALDPLARVAQAVFRLADQRVERVAHALSERRITDLSTLLPRVLGGLLRLFLDLVDRLLLELVAGFLADRIRRLVLQDLAQHTGLGVEIRAESRIVEAPHVLVLLVVRGVEQLQDIGSRTVLLAEAESVEIEADPQHVFACGTHLLGLRLDAVRLCGDGVLLQIDFGHGTYFSCVGLSSGAFMSSTHCSSAVPFLRKYTRR